MGRTLATANQLILTEEQAFADFRRALRKEDQRAFDALFARARLHTPAISQASHALPFETILLTMLVELWKEVEHLRREELGKAKGVENHERDQPATP